MLIPHVGLQCISVTRPQADTFFAIIHTTINVFPQDIFALQQITLSSIAPCEKPNYSVTQIQCCCPGYKTEFGAGISGNERVIPEVALGLLTRGSQSVVVICHFITNGWGVRGTTHASFYIQKG